MTDEKLKGCVPNLRTVFRKVTVVKSNESGSSVGWEEVEPMGIRKGDVVRFEDSDEELVASSDSYREPLGPAEEPFASWVPAFQYYHAGETVDTPVRIAGPIRVPKR